MEKCQGPECEREAIKKGHCGAHYNQMRKYGYTWKFGDNPHRQRKTCTFEGCDRPNFAHGLCAAHRRQKHLGIELRPVRPPRPSDFEGYHWCGTCKQFRPVEDFGWDSTRNQLKRRCADCHAAYGRIYNKANAERIRLRVTLRTWGLTEQQYRGLFDAQDHRCAICGVGRRTERELSVDHCHTTGRIRGLLCQDCNLGMGQFADDPALMEAAAAYLRAGGVVHDESLSIPADSPELSRARKRDELRARRTEGAMPPD